MSLTGIIENITVMFSIIPVKFSMFSRTGRLVTQNTKKIGGNPTHFPTHRSSLGRQAIYRLRI